MLFWLDENQSVLPLPPLSKDSVAQWFEVGWQGFSESLQGRPETYPYLRDSHVNAGFAGFETKS